METPKPEQLGRAPRRAIIVVAVGLVALAGLAGAIALGGYSRFYRAFLQPERRAEWASPLAPIAGIAYVAKIDDGLYRGAWPAENLAALKSLGIKTIINFRSSPSHDYQARAEAMGFDYHWMPIDPTAPPDPEFIARFLAIVTDPTRRPAYIHCALGVDRTGLMSGIYRIERQGWTAAQAVAEMEFFGHNEVWIDLEELLKTYRKQAPSGLEPKAADR